MFNDFPVTGGSQLELFGQLRSLGHHAAPLNEPAIGTARIAAPSVPTADPAGCSVQYYSSLIELRSLLKSICDEATAPATDSGPAACLPVVVVLPANFSGPVAPLIRRRGFDKRLFLAVASGQLRLPDWSFLDDHFALGWRQIAFESDWRVALRKAYDSVGAGDRVAVYWPAWGEQASDASEPQLLLAAERSATTRRSLSGRRVHKVGRSHE